MLETLTSLSKACWSFPALSVTYSPFQGLLSPGGDSERSEIRNNIFILLDSKVGIQPEGMVSTLFFIVILEKICCNEYNLFSRSVVSRQISNRKEIQVGY